jgi:hypothetical protein
LGREKSRDVEEAPHILGDIPLRDILEEMKYLA